MLSAITLTAGSLDIDLAATEQKLTIFGNETADTLIIAVDGTTTAAIPLAEVSAIHITANDLDNTVDLSGIPLGTTITTTVELGAGNDTLIGSMASDVVLGGDGDDLIFGGGQPDTVTGGEGNDTLSGNSGDDSLGGGTGDDSLLGQAGNDAIGAGFGLDQIDGVEASGSNEDADKRVSIWIAQDTFTIFEGEALTLDGRGEFIDLTNPMLSTSSIQLDWDLNGDLVWDASGTQPTVTWAALSGRVSSR